MSASHYDIGPPPSGSTLPLRRSIVPISSFPLATDEQGGVDSGEGVLVPTSDSLEGREGASATVCLVPSPPHHQHPKGTPSLCVRHRHHLLHPPPFGLPAFRVPLRPTLRPLFYPTFSRLARQSCSELLQIISEYSARLARPYRLLIADASSRPRLLQASSAPCHQEQSRSGREF